ncbi:MAG: chemotaxis protein CheX [Oscillospiraceae bacterium]|jgi:chemotaxis protein CheX|nr:chemotaxis protein CheX [Oscillospiraceae bacterium]
MNDAFYQSFLEATRNVFHLMLDLDQLTEKHVQPDTAESSAETICIAIGVTGSLQGKITYIFPNDTTLKMVKIMSGGMEFSAVDDFVTSAIGEIANIISGKALIELSERKIACDILPPEVLPNGVPKGTGHCKEQNRVALHTDIGDIELDIQLEAQK